MRAARAFVLLVLAALVVLSTLSCRKVFPKHIHVDEFQRPFDPHTEDPPVVVECGLAVDGTGTCKARNSSETEWDQDVFLVVLRDKSSKIPLSMGTYNTGLVPPGATVDGAISVIPSPCGTPWTSRCELFILDRRQAAILVAGDDQ